MAASTSVSRVPVIGRRMGTTTVGGAATPHAASQQPTAATTGPNERRMAVPSRIEDLRRTPVKRSKF